MWRKTNYEDWLYRRSSQLAAADDDAAPHFAFLAKLARDHGLANLSMGMSGDFELAVKFGATHVRVGTAIFGTRQKTDQPITI